MLDMDDIISGVIPAPAKNISQPVDERRLPAVDRLERLAGGNRQGGIEKGSPDRLFVIIYGPAPGPQGLRVRQIDLSRPDGEYIHFMPEPGQVSDQVIRPGSHLVGYVRDNKCDLHDFPDPARP
jgi:hypothetical protein